MGSPEKMEVNEPTTNTPSKVLVGIKRKAVESLPNDSQNEQHSECCLSLKDVIDKISEATKVHSEEFSALRSDIAILRQEVNSQIELMQRKVEDVENSIESIKTRIDGVDSKIDEIAETSSLHGKEINRLMQEKLECNMEIAGLKPEIIEGTEDVEDLAIKTISSQGIAIDKNDIARVSKRVFHVIGKNQNQNKKGIINVVFKDFNKKVQVMKQKRLVHDKDKSIYFNTALTPFNRHFMSQAKEITEGKLKVYFGRGCVRVVKKDKSEIMIDETSKLDDLKEYMQSINTPN
jgi:hypothetical protein